MNKILLVCMVVISILGVSTTVQAQDTCDKYFNKYRVCVEQRDAGNTMDYDVCKNYTDQLSCEGARCYWNGDKSVCTINMCLMDGSLDGQVKTTDLGIYKKEYGRIDCPTTPFVPAPAPVPKTGQTSSSTTGDDGDLQKGVAWPDPRFTILYHYLDGMINVPCEPPTVECENPPNPLNDIVIDNLTGLQWLRDAGGFPAMTWTSALSNVGWAGFIGGHDDWRVPNIRELESLLDFQGGAGFAPFLPIGHPFENVRWSSGDEYWSSTQWITLGPPAALTTSFLDGLRYQRAITDTHSLWPVRGGQ